MRIRVNREIGLKLSIQELSPDLKIGMTFAILNWIRTTPQEKDKLKIWKIGSINEEIVCFRKLVEMPKKSGVFLSFSCLVASIISSLVKGLLLRLKETGFCGIKKVWDFGEGFTFWTVLLAMLANNSFKWPAMVAGSLIFKSLTVKWDMSLLFLLLLLIEEKRILRFWKGEFQETSKVQ